MENSYRLISFDLDGTLVRKPTLQVLARNLGFERRLLYFDSLLEKKQITKWECLRRQFALFRGYRASDLLTMMRSVPQIRGIRRTVRRLKSLGLIVVILSDNPTVLSSYFMRFGFDRVLGSTAIVRRGVLTGRAKIAAKKLPALRRFCRVRNIKLSECVHVGDWNNDIPVFKAVGLSIAINPKNRSVSRNASLTIRTKNLLALYSRISPILKTR
jgi:phosphoserine phosphatase